MRALQATECMQRSSHNFVYTSFSKHLRPSARCCKVDHCTVLFHPDPDTSVLMKTRCRSVADHCIADIDFCRCRPPLMTIDDGPTDFLISSLWLDQSSCWFSVTLHVLYDVQFTILYEYQTTSLVVQNSTFIGSSLQMLSISAMTSADWFRSRDVTCHVWWVMHVVSRFLRIFAWAEMKS